MSDITSTPCPSYAGKPCEEDCICDVRAELERVKRDRDQCHQVADERGDELVRMVIKLGEVTRERDELLEALEDMAHQYLAPPAGHAFMSTGEDATELLARLCPDRWKDDGRGPVWIGENQ